jgi:hypothetical protein
MPDDRMDEVVQHEVPSRPRDHSAGCLDVGVRGGDIRAVMICGAQGGGEALARFESELGGGVQSAESQVVPGAHSRISLHGLTDLTVVMDLEETTVDTDQEDTCLFLLGVLAGPPTVLESGSDGVDEARGHETVEVALGVRGLECVVQQPAHTERGRESKYIGAVGEDLRVTTDREL